MIAQFLSDEKGNSNTLNIGEVNDDLTLPIWCEDIDDSQTYCDVKIDDNDLDQLISILITRQSQLRKLKGD